MNYKWMLADHLKSNAELTIAVQEVPIEEAGRFGIFEVDENKKILNFEEKPAEPKSNPCFYGNLHFQYRCTSGISGKYA